VKKDAAKKQQRVIDCFQAASQNSVR
jgi:hypothetical protein